MCRPHSRRWAWGLVVASACAGLGPPPAVAQTQVSRPCTIPKEVLDLLATAPTVRDVASSLQSSEVREILDRAASDVNDAANDGIPKPPASEVPCDLLAGPKAIAVQSGIAQVTVTGFTGAILGRLDGTRGATADGDSPTSTASYGPSGMMALGRTQKRPSAPPGATSPLTVYAMGTYLGGNSDVPNMAGFTYDSTGGVVGVEYSVNRNLILGLAGGTATTGVTLDGDATLDAAGLQAAAYLSYATRHFFLDVLAAYGAVGLDTERPGAGGTIRGSTDAGAWVLAARTGYLFQFGKLRAGPIAGLTYLRTHIDGYTETGDPLALTVGAQVVESFAGSAGLRFLAPFQAGGTLFIPYLNVTQEHQFGDSTQVIVTSLPQQSPVALSLPAFGARDYGKVEGGVTVELAPQATLSVSGASSFAREDGQDHRISAGLNYRF
jgi:outer membrane lipase/esterase